MTHIKTYPKDEAKLKKDGFSPLSEMRANLYLATAGDKVTFFYYSYVRSAYHASAVRLSNFCAQDGNGNTAISKLYPSNTESVIGTPFVKWNAYREAIEIDGVNISSLMTPVLFKNLNYLFGRTALYFPLNPYTWKPDINLFIDMTRYFIHDDSNVIVYSSNYPVYNYINSRAFPMNDDDVILNTLLIKGNSVSWETPYTYPNKMFSFRSYDGSYNIVQSTESSFNVRF